MAKLLDPTPDECMAVIGGRKNITSFDIPSIVLDQHPRWTYRWVNKKDVRVSHLKVFGWSVVSRGSISEGDGARGGAWNEGAGAWTQGDLILMKCRKDVFETRQKRKQERFKALSKKPEEDFDDTADKLGVKTFNELE